MTLLPIVVRELRVAARRKATYRTRFWTVFFAIAVSAYVVLVSGRHFETMGGVLILSALAALCLLGSLFLGASTVDSISSEKREGTLGFLFLTDLKGYDIALGKLCSTSLYSLYAILGVFPIVAVSLLLGGIRVIDVIMVALGVLNAFFFSHAAGLFVSSVSRKRAAATTMGAVLLLGYTMGLFIVTAALEGTPYWALRSILCVFNPGYAVYCALLATFSRIARAPVSAGGYWVSLLVVHFNAWLFLGLASWWLPNSWQDKPKKAKVTWRERFLHWYHERNTPRQSLLDANPFCWMIMRQRLGALKAWAALLVINCYWVWLLSQMESFRDSIPVFIGVVAGNHLILKMLFAVEAGHTLEEQRHNGELEFLLSCTPLSVSDIIAGQWRALRRQFLRPAIIVVAFDLVFLLLDLFHARGGFDPDEKTGFALFVLTSLAMLAIDLVTLGWVGMWNAMYQKKPKHASGTTVALILVFPWVLVGLVEGTCGVLHINWTDSFVFLLVISFLFGVAVDVPALILARHRLQQSFRALAAPHSRNDPSLPARLGRWLGILLRPKPPVVKV